MNGSLSFSYSLPSRTVQFCPKTVSPSAADQRIAESPFHDTVESIPALFVTLAKQGIIGRVDLHDIASCLNARLLRPCPELGPPPSHRNRCQGQRNEPTRIVGVDDFPLASDGTDLHCLHNGLSHRKSSARNKRQRTTACPSPVENCAPFRPCIRAIARRISSTFRNSSSTHPASTHSLLCSGQLRRKWT